MEDRIDRSRILDFEDEDDSGYSPASEVPAKFLGQVYDGGSMPTELNHYFLVHPVVVDGDPTEGGPATLTADTSASVAVDVIGPLVPSVGDYIEVFRSGGRWVSGSGGSVEDTDCLVTYHVTGCSAAIAGATVALWTDSGKSTPVASGTTDIYGNVTLDVGDAGTYYREVSATSWVTAVATAAVTCGASYTVNLAPTPPRTCGICCLPHTPDVLYVTDGLGTTAMTRSLTGFGWEGIGTFSMSGISVYTVDGFASHCLLGTGDIQVLYQFVCLSGSGGSSTWQLGRYWGQAHTDADPTGWYYGTGPPGSYGERCAFPFFPGFDSCTAIGTATTADAETCDPFFVSGTTTMPPFYNADCHTSDPGGGVFAVSV